MESVGRVVGQEPRTVAVLFGLLQAGAIAALVVLFFEDETLRTVGLGFAAVSGILVAVVVSVLIDQLNEDRGRGTKPD